MQSVYNYVVEPLGERYNNTKKVGDKELMQLLNQQEINTRAAALEYETSQGDFTMFGFKDGENYHNSYQPYAALQR